MNCIIIEDEIPAQKILKKFIEKIPSLRLLGVFKAAIEANSFLNNNNTIDLVLLDINLPDISGIDFIKTIKNPPAVIMTTAYPDYAVNSFELETIVDYLVKPFSFDRFLKAINKVKDRIEVPKNIPDENAEILFLNVDKTLHKLVLNSILYIESDRNYITVVTENKKLSYIDSLKNWTLKLPEKQFFQVHKSYIVNSKFVDKISGNILFVKNNKIPIGRTFKQNLLKALGV
jgi:DNA-binding LytR/AlgR family response regulator